MENLEKLPVETLFPVVGKAFWEEEDSKKPYFMQIAIPEINQDWPRLEQISQKWIDADWKKNENTSKAKGILYENRSDYEGAKQLGGAILEANLDLTHPINYGISSNKIAVFKNHLSAMQPDSQSYNNPILFSSKPLISGYAPKGIPEFLGNTSVFKVARKGSGRVVAINDNPLFRSYWVATEKWFWNAVFFAKEM